MSARASRAERCALVSPRRAGQTLVRGRSDAVVDPAQHRRWARSLRPPHQAGQVGCDLGQLFPRIDRQIGGSRPSVVAPAWAISPQCYAQLYVPVLVACLDREVALGRRPAADAIPATPVLASCSKKALRSANPVLYGFTTIRDAISPFDCNSATTASMIKSESSGVSRRNSCADPISTSVALLKSVDLWSRAG
jgi:hypothetical protein